MAIHDATIAIDFDGTVVTHAYPEIGEDAGAAPVLKELTDNGCRLILYSMRHGKLLDRAVEWFRVRGIPLYAVNESAGPRRRRFMQTFTSTTAIWAVRCGSSTERNIPWPIGPRSASSSSGKVFWTDAQKGGGGLTKAQTG